MGPIQPRNQWVSGVKRPERELTTFLHLVPRSRMHRVYLHSPIHFRGVVLSEAQDASSWRDT